MTIRPSDLNNVKTLDDVLGFLADELDWPIAAADLDDATFDYTADELGVPPDQVPSLVRLSQLRPLTTDQPWGIFFLEFEGPKLPLVQLRRLLSRLVERKRRGGTDRKTWALNDLLFVVMATDESSVEMHLVAFSDEGSGLPALRTLQWRPGDTPKRRLDRLCTELLPRLAWPDEGTTNDQWRSHWREAFRLRHGQAIKDAERLAQRMAEVAREMRSEIAAALSVEDGAGPLSALHLQFREQLLGDAGPEQFADTAAQTLVYGLLTNRITDPEGFGASPTLSAVPLANRFLAEFFVRVLTQVQASAATEDSLEQLIADLRATNVEAVLDEFGGSLRGGDPVIHLYEHFLAMYDRQQRADSGAFYTPLPVVRFMVQAVDQALTERFGLPLGLADGASWADVAAIGGFEVPSSMAPDARFLTMIDPAAGTGTFLVEWIRQSRVRFDEARPDGDWPAHLRDVVLPSMHGFELNPAAYAIAHVKLALECHDSGLEAPDEVIVLTSTLEHPAAQASLIPSLDLIAHQGQLADRLKTKQHFTVAIGNPPYDREQRSSDSNARRKGGIVRHGAPGIAPLLAPILDSLSAAGQGIHAKNLYNDYVYFWRWVTWQVCERDGTPGVVALITPSSYLDGKSFGSFREHLRSSFNELWIVDLGGDNRGAYAEENIFDIQTPVAIAVGIRYATRKRDECAVHYARVRGTREQKFMALGALPLDDSHFQPVPGQGFDHLTQPAEGEYFDWPATSDMFPSLMSGCKVSRTWPISPSEQALQKRWKALVASDGADRPTLLKESRDRKVGTTVEPMLSIATGPLPPLAALPPGARNEGLVRYGFRSFDRQWLIADNRLIDYRGAKLWPARPRNQVFLTTLTSTRLSSGPALVATPYVPDLHHFCGRGAKDVTPLWLDGAGKNANVADNLLRRLSEIHGQDITAHDLLAYTYGLLGTAAYAKRFANEIGQAPGAPRVPITKDGALFNRAVSLGEDLLLWHMWGTNCEGKIEQLPLTVNEIEPVTSVPADFQYDTATSELVVGDGRFGPVSPEAWAFEVSGLRALRSWISQRLAHPAGRRSSPLDEIGPDTWDQSDELRLVVSIIQHTIDAEPTAAELLASVVDNPLLYAADLNPQ